MIHLELLDGKHIALNPDQLLLVEAVPDTLIRLLNGERFLVKNSVESVESQFMAFKRSLHQRVELEH